MKDLKLILMSHGLKTINAPHGRRIIPTADFYVDCRGVIDHATGPTALKESPDTLGAMFAAIVDSIRRIPTRRNTEQDPYSKPYVVCFMCAHGQNRSVVSKNLMATRLRAVGFNVEVK